MGTQRLKGQEVTVIIVTGGVVENEINEIQSMDFEFEQEQLQQGYLGQFSDQFDYVFKGVKGSLDLHIHTGAWFDFLKKITDKAKRITPDTVFNITAVANFANEGAKTILFPDVSFGGIGHTIGGRTEYVKIKLPFGTSDAQVSG